MQNFLQQLKTLSSAEDFLQFFGIPYEQKVVDVSRLHILKRFFQYIRQQPNLPKEEIAVYRLYHQMLTLAYNDFVVSTPAQEKVFKVFQDVDGRQHVTLDNLRAALPSRDAA